MRCLQTFSATIFLPCCLVSCLLFPYFKLRCCTWPCLRISGLSQTDCSRKFSQVTCLKHVISWPYYAVSLLEILLLKIHTTKPHVDKSEITLVFCIPKVLDSQETRQNLQCMYLTVMHACDLQCRHMIEKIINQDGNQQLFSSMFHTQDCEQCARGRWILYIGTRYLKVKSRARL